MYAEYNNAVKVSSIPSEGHSNSLKQDLGGVFLKLFVLGLHFYAYVSHEWPESLNLYVSSLEKKTFLCLEKLISRFIQDKQESKWNISNSVTGKVE